MIAKIDRNLAFNFGGNILDGAFFGLAIGFASFGTNIPLFLTLFTSSATLVGLIPAIHVSGLQFPPLFTVGLVSRLKRYKAMVLICGISERLPFLGLAAVAWLMEDIRPAAAVALIFGLLAWQGLGGGIGMTAWQSMLAKVLPPTLRGTFFGLQAAAFNGLAAISAVIAGVILDRVGPRFGFTWCFLLCFGALTLSWLMVALTREGDTPPHEITTEHSQPAAGKILAILKRDGNFRWFVFVRMLAQLAAMAFSFYMVFIVARFGVTKTIAGVLTSVSMIAGIVANPLMGWVGDRWGHYRVLGMGFSAAALSALLAGVAPSAGWFYPVVILSSIANVAIWTVSMAMTLEFGQPEERQAYIGLSNTLIAPITILAPILGGWLADSGGYQTTFLVSALFGLITIGVFLTRLHDPRKKPAGQPEIKPLDTPDVESLPDEP